MSSLKHFNIDTDATEQGVSQASLIASRLGLTLVAYLLDAGNCFEKAAYASAEAYQTLQNVAIGICPDDATIVIELGPQQRVRVFENGGEARAYAAQLGSPFIGIDVAYILRLSGLSLKKMVHHENLCTAH